MRTGPLPAPQETSSSSSIGLRGSVVHIKPRYLWAEAMLCYGSNCHSNGQFLTSRQEFFFFSSFSASRSQ